jgi:CRP-like cAMP-binding protein
VLATSELRNQVLFGTLSAFTMAVGWLLELTLSPAICSGIRIVTLWDLLRLDLGLEPQKSIPLFEGLTERQARIFGLMSQLVSVPAGDRLMSEGDKGNEMYIVIDGELSISLQRDGRRLELSRSTRGDVVGEIALFTEVRSADVEVVSDARLLRFGQADLERLGKRYPRVAARVYKNLNRVIAARVVNTQRVFA